MNPQSTVGTQTPTHITTAHHHTGSQGCSSNQLQTPTSLPAARSQDRQPTQLLTRELPCSSSSSQNQHAASRKEQRLLPPSHTALNTRSSALPPDTSSASLGSASPRSAPAVSCTLPLTPTMPALQSSLLPLPAQLASLHRAGARLALLGLRLCFDAPKDTLQHLPRPEMRGTALSKGAALMLIQLCATFPSPLQSLGQPVRWLEAQMCPEPV